MALGLAASRERSGGNITGITGPGPEHAKQQAALFKDVVPDLRRVAIPSDQTIPGARRKWPRAD
jgi:putative tryptophan/tyrosine transport system substrate-binding protein